MHENGDGEMWERGRCGDGEEESVQKQMRFSNHTPPHPDQADLVTALGQGRKGDDKTQMRYEMEAPKGWISPLGNAEYQKKN